MNLFDISNDLFLLSTNNLNAETITNYQLVASHLKKSKDKNQDFIRIDQLKKEFSNIIRDMRAGHVFLDPKVSFKNDNGEEFLVDPSKISENVSQSNSANPLPKSNFEQIKRCFEDLKNDCWFFNQNQKKEGL